MIASLLLFALGALQVRPRGTLSERSFVIPYMKIEAVVTHTAAENATTTLFLFQMAMMRSIIKNEERE